MREHQIVITLKPEQFLQVQKLARSAGAKSMGMFVRQQLLAALGIEGATAAKADADLDLEPIKTELKRLHAELREFVSESLSSYSGEFNIGSEAEAISVELQGGLPFSVEDPGFERADYDYNSDEMEETAEKTFAISPRLGAIESEEPSYVQSRIEDEVVKQIPEPQADVFVPQPVVNDKPFEDERSPHIPQTSKPDATIFEAPPFFAQKQSSTKTPWVFQNADQQSAGGATSSASRDERDAGRDPLSELLGAGEMAQPSSSASSADSDDDDDSYDVPLSILTRRRQLAQMRSLEEQGGVPSEKRDADLNKPFSSVPPPKPDKPGLSEEKKSPDNTARKEEESPKPADTQRNSGSFAVFNPLENPDEDSPFSGGPPPKKRQ